MVTKYNRHVTTMSIFEAGHFSHDQCQRILSSYTDYERDARTKGIPRFDEGRIFPAQEGNFVVEPFKLPEHFPQIGCIDFGWNHPTAALKLAWDLDLDIVYVNKEYRQREATPAEHASILKGWGKNLCWAWPHDGLKHEYSSGDTLANLYKKQGMNMLSMHAHYKGGGYSLEKSIDEILGRINSGRLKIFANLSQLREEINFYHRDEGRIVKEKDDLISALRYGVMMLRYAKKPPQSKWSYAIVD